MSIAHLLDNFATPGQNQKGPINEVELEEERLMSFDKGYQAGWDDAVKSQVEDGRRITADLAQNLQDLNFTREEIHAAIMEGLQPVLQQITGAALPEMCRLTLVPRISEILGNWLEQEGHQPVSIAVGPEDAPLLDMLITQHPDLDCKMVEDNTLSSGQIYLRIANAERALDMHDVLQRIEQAVTAFFSEHQKAVA